MADDTTLISRAQNGDEQAFSDLVKRYHAFVYAIVIGILKDSHDAEEVVQDVFVNAYRGLPQLEDAAKFNGWLAEIARNCVRDRMRGQRVDTVSINEVGEHTLQAPDTLDAQLIRDEQRALIRCAMESLSVKDKEIVKGYYLDGASYDELIRTHGLSYKAISVRLSRAKRKLAKRLRHLLTGVFVSPSMTFQQICTGGLTVMKVGTVSKITVSAAAIIGLVVIGTHHFILSKEESSPSVEIVTSKPSGSTHSVARTDSTPKRAASAPQPANEPQISAEQMEQIESFFAQLEEIDAQDLEKTEEAFLSEVDNEVTLDTIETEVVSEPQEERFFGLTLSEIEAQIPVLEEEIRTNLTQAVELYTDLRSTDGIRPLPPEIAEWRDETWAEVKRLFKEVDRQKIPHYVSYLSVTGGENPLGEGGWLSELMKPLPMRVSYDGTSP